MLARCLRYALPLFAASLLGCATTVHRVGADEVVLAAGEPRNACEEAAWLVLAPTSREEPTAGGKSTTVSDGLGMYRVGGDDPVSIPAYSEDLGPSPIVTRHKDAVAPHDRDRLIAAGLGVAAVASIVVGTALFVTGLSRTKMVTDKETGLKKEESDINGPMAGWGAGIAVVGGFGFGAAGLTVNPDSAERAEADAYRHVFTPEDGLLQVQDLVNRHNLSARTKCSAQGAAGSAVSGPKNERSTVEEKNDD